MDETFSSALGIIKMVGPSSFWPRSHTAFSTGAGGPKLRRKKANEPPALFIGMTGLSTTTSRGSSRAQVQRRGARATIPIEDPRRGNGGALRKAPTFLRCGISCADRMRPSQNEHDEIPSQRITW